MSSRSNQTSLRRARKKVKRGWARWLAGWSAFFVHDSAKIRAHKRTRDLRSRKLVEARITTVSVFDLMPTFPGWFLKWSLFWSLALFVESLSKNVCFCLWQENHRQVLVRMHRKVAIQLLLYSTRYTNVNALNGSSFSNPVTIIAMLM